VCFLPVPRVIPALISFFSTAHGPSVYFDSWFSNTHRDVLQLNRQANRTSSRRSRGSQSLGIPIWKRLKKVTRHRRRDGRTHKSVCELLPKHPLFSIDNRQLPRIKSVKTLEIALPKESGRTSTIIACTVSSDGFINVYDIADVPQDGIESPPKPKQIQPLSSYDSKGTRLTCLALADGDLGTNPVEIGKRKRDEGESDEGEEDSETNWGGIKGEQSEDDSS